MGSPAGFSHWLVWLVRRFEGSGVVEFGYVFEVGFERFRELWIVHLVLAVSFEAGQIHHVVNLHNRRRLSGF